MNNSTTIPAVLTIDEIMKAVGHNAADPTVIFKEDTFDGTLEYRDNPMASKEAYSDQVDAMYEITAVDEMFPGMTVDELAIACHAVLRLCPEGNPQPVSNDPRTTPGTRRVESGYDWETHEMQTTVVPAGEMSVPGFGGKRPGWQPTFRVGTYGGVPMISASIVRGQQDRAQGIFEFIRRYANQHSIYLGQVFDQNFQFIKMTDFKPQNVALTDAHRNAVDLFVRGPLQFDFMNDRLGIAPKSGLFFHGDPGGGKTMIMNLCAYIGAKAGAAVALVDPEAGVDGFKRANDMTMRLMQSGHKVMICMEDMEKLARQARATVLDILDGGGSKGLRRIVVGTTNFIDTIDRAMLRPGRFDGVEHAGLPDLPAFTMLLGILLEGHDLSEVDYAEAFKAFDGYTYAFMANAVTNILRAFVIRTQGQDADVKITTQDLINSANSVRGHFDLLQVPVVEPEPQLDALFKSIVAGEVDEQLDMRHFSDDVDYSEIGDLAYRGANSAIESQLDGAGVLDQGGDLRFNISTNG